MKIVYIFDQEKLIHQHEQEVKKTNFCVYWSTDKVFIIFKFSLADFAFTVS